MKISEKDLDLLINKLKSNDLTNLEYHEDDFKIVLANSNTKIVSNDTLLNENNFEYQTNNTETTPQNVETTNQKENEDTVIYSPLIGNFYLTKDPEAPNFVNVGDKVKKGDVLCVIEAMKMISEVKSDYDGKITEICAEPATFVDLDTPIFKICEE